MCQSAGHRDRRQRDQAKPGPACSTTWARPSTTRWRAPMWPSAWNWRRSTGGQSIIRHQALRQRVDPGPWWPAYQAARRHLRRPARRPAEPGKLYQAAGKLEEVPLPSPGGEIAFAVQAGRRSSPSKPDPGLRGSDGSAGPGYRQEIEEAGYPGQIQGPMLRETKVISTRSKARKRRSGLPELPSFCRGTPESPTV